MDNGDITGAPNNLDYPAVQRNVEAIKESGFRIIGPEVGRLACGTEGIGRMAEANEILKEIEEVAAKLKAQNTK